MTEKQINDLIKINPDATIKDAISIFEIGTLLSSCTMEEAIEFELKQAKIKSIASGLNLGRHISQRSRDFKKYA